MKNLIKIMLALTLITSTVFADNGENGVMDKLTGDNAFESTKLLFNETVSDETTSTGAYFYGIATVPTAVIESVIWLTRVPFHIIKIAVEDEED